MSALQHPSRRMRAVFGLLLAAAIALAPALLPPVVEAAPGVAAAFAASYEAASGAVIVPSERLAIELRDAPVRLALGGLLLAGLLATLGYGVAYGLSWLARRRGRAPEGAVLAATLSAAANVAYAAAILVLFSRVDPLSIERGAPGPMWPLVILPMVGIAAAVLLVVVLARAWHAGDGSTGHRVALSLAAAASLGFTAWLIVRGLLLI